MTITNASFRVDFPEFGDTTAFPDQQVNFWLNYAQLSLDAGRWSTWLDLGTELWMAHNLTMEARAIMEAANGNNPGITTGAINSKSADKVSVGFDTGASTEEKGGHWNTTIYGTRYFRMAKMIGAGPVQIGVGCPVNTDGTPYPGPWFANFPNPSC